MTKKEWPHILKLGLYMNNFNIKEHLFNPNGRFSREAFAVSYGGLVLFSTLTGPLLLKLCNMLLPFFLVFLLTAAYVIYVLYAMCVVCIKRVHDLNLPGWYGVVIVLTPLNILLLPYLILKKGNPVENDYGEPQRYKSKPLFLYGSYAFCFLYMAGWATSIFLWTQTKDIKDNPQQIQTKVSQSPLFPKKLKEELKNKPRAVGSVSIEGRFATLAVTITQNRILVQGTNFQKPIQQALSQGQAVTIQFSDNSSANITRFIGADESLKVQMSVFEMDKAIGTPGRLNQRNREILERINAF